MHEVRSGLPVLGFSDDAAFARWLAAQPANAPGAWVKLARKTADGAGISRRRALDAALCHGWIDGQAVKYDDSFFLTRFTPRRPRSGWSELNRTRALQLIEEGRMRPTGMAEVEAAKADGRWDAAYPPPSTATVPDDLRDALDANARAAVVFEALTRSNRYALLHGIATARKAETRKRRITQSIDRLERGETSYK